MRNVLYRLQRQWVHFTATADSGGEMTFSDWCDKTDLD